MSIGIQPSPQCSKEQPLRLKSLQKLGRLLGITTGTTLYSEERSPRSSGTPSTRHLLPSVASSPPASSLSLDDCGQSSTSSHTTLKPSNNNRRPRTLHHSVSTPVMCTIRTQFHPLPPVTPPYDTTNYRSSPFSLRDLQPYLFSIRPQKPRISSRDENTLFSQTPSVPGKWKWKKKGSEGSKFPHTMDTDAPSGSKQPQPQHSNSRTRPFSTIPWSEPFEATSLLSSTLDSLPAQDRPLTRITSSDSIASIDSQRTQEEFARRRSLNKLARTLGVAPSELPSLNELPLSSKVSGKPFLPTRSSSAVAKAPSNKALNRKSLSLSTLTSLPTLFRSPPRSPTQPLSRTSSSTLNTDDVHRFDLADDLSDTWGETRDDSQMSMHSPISPITFHPPTPQPIPPVKASPNPPPPSDRVIQEGSSGRSSSRRQSALTRAKSQSYVSSRFNQRLGNDGCESRSHTPFEYETELPIKANWLDSASPLVHDPPNKPPVMEHPDDEKPKTWSGNWNQDDMQQVIKMLRNLK